MYLRLTFVSSSIIYTLGELHRHQQPAVPGRPHQTRQVRQVPAAGRDQLPRLHEERGDREEGARVHLQRDIWRHLVTCVSHYLNSVILIEPSMKYICQQFQQRHVFVILCTLKFIFYPTIFWQ